MRKHIDRLTLRLANVGIDIELLDFYHDPSKQAIRRAKQTLMALGALTGANTVTPIGRLMEQYPVESSYGRMLVEAGEYSSDIQTKLAAIIAIQEVGGIVKGGTRYTGWKAFTKQKRSDLLAQYDVFRALATISPDEYEELGIIGKNITKASEVMERLNRDLSDIELDPTILSAISPDEESLLLRCIVSGQIDQLWTVDEYGNATHVSGNATRELSGTTVVRNTNLIAGTPFDLQVPSRDGTLQTLKLVQNISTVETQWLIDFAPEWFSVGRGKMSFDPRSGNLVIRQSVRIGKRVFEGSGEVVTDNNRQNQKFFQDAVAKWVHSQLETERTQLSAHHAKRIPSVPLSEVKAYLRPIIGGVISTEAMDSDKRRHLFELAKLATHFGDDFMRQVAQSFRQEKTPGRHHAHRGWKPSHKRFDRRKGR
jgi:hypothetical protein